VKRLTAILLVCLAAAAGAGCGGGDDDSSTASSESTAASTESSAAPESNEAQTGGAKKTKPKVTVPSGPPPKKLEIKELEKGTGATAKAGDEVTVQYVGVGYDSEEEFDSSWGGAPFPFPLGAGAVIKGWDQGVAGMKVGGRRELIIPPNLAYGAAPPSPAIAPNETLIFVVDLLAVE
jgi:peptidylprolyl isomerase